jgi:uncharacterized protein YcgL (UPF0745 family)
MIAHVYKSLRQADAYLYLRARDAFELVPEAVAARLGELAFVLEVALTPERRLARVDAALVREALAGQGWFVQLPPTAPPPERADG